MNKILETSNYDMFDLLDFNRDVKKTNALERSMQKYGWIDAYPMHVVNGANGKVKIKAGHHRFAVARKLGIKCKYVIADDMGESVHELENATARWSLQDYLTSFCRVGNKNYLAVKEYVDRTGIPLMCSIAMI